MISVLIFWAVEFACCARKITVMGNENDEVKSNEVNFIFK